MVEVMATETWLCVRSILRCTGTTYEQLSLISIQGKMMYIEIAKAP
jgi:hypothetical protein